MPFKFWFYVSQFVPLFFLAVVLGFVFIPDSIILKVIMCCIILLCICGAIMGFMLVGDKLRMSCPFCGRSEVPGASKKTGLYLSCKSCGQVKGSGLFGLKLEKKNNTNVKLVDITIDLGSLACGHTKLGSLLSEKDSFAQHFNKLECLYDIASGIEIGVKSHILDYVFITIANSNAKIVKSGDSLSINSKTTIPEIIAIFGEPYWEDEDESEIILFYEYNEGTFEMQFEFSDKLHLGFITIMQNGVLSTSEQRELCGITKPWPPQNTIRR